MNGEKIRRIDMIMGLEDEKKKVNGSKKVVVKLQSDRNVRKSRNCTQRGPTQKRSGGR